GRQRAREQHGGNDEHADGTRAGHSQRNCARDRRHEHHPERVIFAAMRARRPPVALWGAVDREELMPEIDAAEDASAGVARLAAVSPGVELGRYLNRELSWLDFNQRVLAIAADESLPILERAKFLAIFSGNLDEFFQVRVGSLKMQLEAGIER